MQSNIKFAYSVIHFGDRLHGGYVASNLLYSLGDVELPPYYCEGEV